MEGKGSADTARCATSAEPVSATLVKIYAGERLQNLPGELQLRPEQLPLYAHYRQAVERLMLDESRWAARAPVAAMSPLLSVGAQIDLASNRTSAWESVLEALKPLYQSLDTAQKTTADRRLVVSLEPSAWGMAGGAKGRPDGGESAGPPADGPPSR